MANWREAHFRLSTSLPSRVHHFEPRSFPETPNTAKRIEVDGVEYQSLRDAVTALKISNSTLYKFIDSGRAKYLWA